MKTRNKANKGVKTLEITKDILDYYLFKESGRKSKFEAFLDIFFNNDKLPDGKEDVKTTFGELAKRWGWGKTSVRRFLNNLEKEGWIKLKISRMNIEITDVNLGELGMKNSKNLTASKSDMLEMPGTVVAQLDSCKSESYEGGRNSRGTVEHIYNNIINNNNIYNNINNNNIYTLSKKFSFENFWNLYDKKVGLKSKIEKKYNKLSLKDKMLIFEHLPKYKEAVPNKKYRKNPETYLNNKSWLDEIIYDKKENKEVKNTSPGNILTAVID